MDVQNVFGYIYRVLGFFFFTGGIFIWIIPIFLLVLGFRAFRNYIDAGSRRDRNGDDFSPVPKKRPEHDTPELRIFKLADRMKGRITLSDIVLETGMGLKEAETFIQKMIDGTHVAMEVTDSGKILYEFPEIIARYENTD